ncbi:MAG: thioesterase family protein [Bacteroidota bacterium]|nr:thioesterase family protein [Bacteroidota bacterium]
MARIKIQLPQKVIASFTIPVRITDINYGNHVGNHAMVEIIHETRVQFLQKHNFTELNAGGTSLIMNELLVEFKNEAFYNDSLEVKIFSGEISRKSFELFYLLTTRRNGATVVIAHAKTGIVCYDYQEKKVDLLPEKLKLILLN